MAPPEPVITPAIKLRKRQNDAQFMGYLSLSGTYTIQECDAPATFYEGSSVAGCCAAQTVACNLPLSCVGGTLFYTNAPSGTRTTSFMDSVACTDQFDDPSATICNTAKVYENINDNIPKTLFYCAPTATGFSIYRAIPTSTNVPIAKSTAMPIPSVASSSTPSATPTNIGPQHKSKAWIAGAVVGPIIGLALVGALIFFLLRARNRNRNKNDASQSGAANMAVVYPSQPPPSNGGYYADTKTNPTAQPSPYTGNQPYNPHHSHSGIPVSPAPQYSAPTVYGEPQSPLPQHSPPPQHSQLPQQGFQPNTALPYVASPTDRAAELS